MPRRPATKDEGKMKKFNSWLHFGRRQKTLQLQFRKKLIVTGLSSQNFEEFSEKAELFWRNERQKNPNSNGIFKAIKTEFHNENKPGIIKIIEDWRLKPKLWPWVTVAEFWWNASSSSSIFWRISEKQIQNRTFLDGIHL
jgi:hypothetical protein